MGVGDGAWLLFASLGALSGGPPIGGVGARCDDLPLLSLFSLDFFILFFLLIYFCQGNSSIMQLHVVVTHLQGL